MYEKLYVYALLYATGYTDAIEQYRDTLDNIVLNNLDDYEAIDLQGKSPKDAVLHTISLMQTETFDKTSFGKALMAEIRNIYEKSKDLEAFSQDMWKLWNFLPERLCDEEPFWTLDYAGECLSYSNEKQCRQLFEEAFNFFEKKKPLDYIHLHQIKLEDELVDRDMQFCIGYARALAGYFLKMLIPWIATYERWYHISKEDYDLYKADKESFYAKYEDVIKYGNAGESFAGAPALRDYDGYPNFHKLKKAKDGVNAFQGLAYIDGILYAHICWEDDDILVPPLMVIRTPDKKSAYPLREKCDLYYIDGKEACYKLKDEYWPFEKETNKSVPTNKEPEGSRAVEHVPLFEKLKKKLGI